MTSLKTLQAVYRQSIADELRDIGRFLAEDLQHDRPGLSIATVVDGRPQQHPAAHLTVRLATADNQTALQFWAAGDEEPALSVIAASSYSPGEERLTLSLESSTGRAELLALSWNVPPEPDDPAGLLMRRIAKSSPLPARGLNAPADSRVGRYAPGDAVQLLQQDVRALLNALPLDLTAAAPVRLASRALTRAAPPRPAIPLPTVELAPIGTSEVQAFPREAPPAATTAAPQTRAGDNAAAIIAALTADLPPGFQDPAIVFREFIRSHAQADGTIDPDDLTAFTQDAMEQILALNEAYLQASSPATAFGVHAQGIMLTLGVIFAAAGEATTSAFGLGHILGTSLEMLPFILGSSVVFGGALLPLTEDKPPAVRRAAFAAALAFGAATATFAALNPYLDDRVQPYLPGYHAIGTAPDGITLETKLAQITAAYRTSLDDTKAARDTVREAGSALLQARRARAHKDAEKERDATKGDAKAAEANRNALQAQMIATQKALDDARENHWSRRAAQGLLFALFSLVNGTGPVVINFYLSKRQAAHKHGTAEAQREHVITATTHNLKVSKKTQAAKARIILAAMRVYYTGELQTAHGLSRAAAEAKAQTVFATLGKMAEKAAEGFRATQQAKARRPFFRLPFSAATKER